VPDGDALQEPTRSLVRDLAHELRDALSPVASSVDLLRLQKFEPQAARATAERMERGLRRALVLLDTFVLAEEVERGSVALEMRRRGLDELLQSAHDALSPELEKRCRFAAVETRTEVSVDHVQTTRVLAALAQHAADMSLPDSPVSLAALNGGAAPRIVLRFRADARFRSPDSWFSGWRSRSPGALPLRTAQRLMLLQRGDLQSHMVASEECEFIVSFTSAANAGVEDTKLPGSALGPERRGSGEAPTRVMIVDDSAEVRKAYREALATLGYSVSEAVNAEEALGTIERDPPQVALIDIHLPQMNGYRLAQTIKARVGASVRLIMLSGMTMDEVTRRLSRQAGFDDCLDKMAGPAALHRLLQTGSSE
jgi:CheY-like chemotaxis protein